MLSQTRKIEMKESDFGLKFLLVERRLGKRGYHYQVTNSLNKKINTKLAKLRNDKMSNVKWILFL